MTAPLPRFGTAMWFAVWAVLNAQAAQGSSLWQSTQFSQYWFQGKAEVNHYKLEQNRYGEMREGHAVLVFVTEDFLPEKQVKADNPDRTQTGAVPVMKLNYIRKFIAGIYDYANMTSVFTPLDALQYPQTLKTNTSIQEWCGQSWLQANWVASSYTVKGFSYYESQGDVTYEMSKAFFEDELYSRIRLGQISEGRVDLVPSGQDARMLHRPWVPQPAVLSVQEGEKHNTLKVKYENTRRRVEVVYEKAFPYGIVKITTRWGDMLLSRLTRDSHAHTAYWKHNHNEDLLLREMLHLPLD